MTDPARQTAHALAALIPPAIAPDFFKDYGLSLAPQQAQAVTKTLLSLTTYWIACAIRASIPEPSGNRMHHVIQEQIREQWDSKFGLAHVPFELYCAERDSQHWTWSRLTQQGGEPITILSEAARSLEAANIIASGDAQKVLALLLDLVPVEEIGEHTAELEQHLRPNF